MDSLVDEHGRREPTIDGDEWTTLTDFLDYQRATFAWKISDLDSAHMALSLAPSTMTLGGMTKHLALVEDDWFSRCLRDEPVREPWASVDWASTPDWDWESAREEDPKFLRTLWNESVTRARTAASAVFEAGGLEQKAARAWADGRAPSLRWIIVHMIEEYARHIGHADLLRESIDGQVGE